MRCGSREKERVPDALAEGMGPVQRTKLISAHQFVRQFVMLRGKFLTLRVLKNEKPPSAFVRKTHTHIRMEYVFVILEETNVIDNINHIEFK